MNKIIKIKNLKIKINQKIKILKEKKEKAEKQIEFKIFKSEMDRVL